MNEKIELLNVEFDTFVVGCKLPKEIVEKDQEISDEFDFDVEIIKKEVNREIGRRGKIFAQIICTSSRMHGSARRSHFSEASAAKKKEG